LLSSWFLVASKDNIVVKAWHKKVVEFWETGKVMPKWFARFYHKLIYILFKLGLISMVKKTMFFMKKLSFFPYFWVHYLFDSLYESNPDIKKIWDNVLTIPADDAHSIIFHGIDLKPSKEILTNITQQKVPVYKLSWRTDISDPTLKESSVVQLIKFTSEKYDY
jgi:hypothetical protein